jgi:hypothetical protein
MRHGSLVLLIVWLLSMGAAYGSSLEPEPGWATGEDMDKAVEVAKQKNTPLVFLYAFRESFSHGTSRMYMKNKDLGGFIKVLVYVSAKPPSAFQKVARQVQEPDRFVPIMYFASPDLQVLGFVQSDSRSDKVSRHATLARELFAWLTKTNSELKRAEKCAADGRFNAALKIYQKASIEDIKNTVTVSKTWEAVLTEQEAKPLYFPDLPDKINGLETMAQERLAKATEHYDKKEYDEAKKLLEPMVKDKADYEAVKRAAELLEKVKAALSSKN